MGSKFDVIYDSIEKLERVEMTELPSDPMAYPFFPKPMLQAVFAKFGLRITQRLFQTLNNKFPDIQPKTTKEVINSWKGKQEVVPYPYCIDGTEINDSTFSPFQFSTLHGKSWKRAPYQILRSNRIGNLSQSGHPPVFFFSFHKRGKQARLGFKGVRLSSHLQ